MERHDIDTEETRQPEKEHLTKAVTGHPRWDYAGSYAD